MNTAETINTATLKQNGSLPIREIAPSALPNNRLVIEPEDPEPKVNGNLPRKNNRRRNIYIGAAILAASLATGAYYYEFVAPYESTDDAFIDAHVTPIAPQIDGRVQELLVRDNQEVKAGDILLQIDPSDYRAGFGQAQAALAAANGQLKQANAQLTADQAKVEQEKANVIAAKADAAQAASDYRRYQAVGDQGISASELDLAGTKAAASEAGVQAAQNKELAAEAQASLDKAGIQTATAEVEKYEADVQQAELNLSYTQVKAPEDGYVTHRTVEAGAYVQPGQPLLAIVPQQVWVVANFKETQLTRMRAGQPVTVKVDAYPQIKCTGHVDSIQHGAGADFSLLPPENASGNYVKVVQRVPVKILLDKISDANVVLGPGMSVEPEVRVN